jgi:hypothetical protein
MSKGKTLWKVLGMPSAIRNFEIAQLLGGNILDVQFRQATNALSFNFWIWLGR